MTNQHEPTVEPLPAPDHAPRRSRRGLAAGLAVGLLGGTAAGLVFGVPSLSSATTNSPAAEQPAQTDEAPAPEDLLEDAELHSTEALRQELQALVDEGVIDAEQADAVAEHLTSSLFDRAQSWLSERGIDLDDFDPRNWKLPDFDLDDMQLGDLDLGDLEARLSEWRERFEAGEFGEFGVHPGPGHPGWPGGIFGRGAGVMSEALTDLLGLDAQELRQQLRDGATLAEIATARGVEPQAVIDEMVAEVRERLDNAVADGHLDQAAADERLAEATEHITQFVNEGFPKPPIAPPTDSPAESPTED